MSYQNYSTEQKKNLSCLSVKVLKMIEFRHRIICKVHRAIANIELMSITKHHADHLRAKARIKMGLPQYVINQRKKEVSCP